MSIKEEPLFPQENPKVYKNFDSFMARHNFKKTINDHCVSMKRYVSVNDHCVPMKRYASCDILIILLYVDDMLIVDHDRNKIASRIKERFGLVICHERIGTNKTNSW